MLRLLCYARRRGLGLSVSMTDVRLLINGYLRWLLKYTSWWIGCGHLGYTSDVLWFATQAQRDHKIIHARNLHVQPQAIMGSGIVEYVA